MSDKTLEKAVGKRPPKTAKGRRVLKAREPQIVEHPKTAIMVAGSKCPDKVAQLLRDLHRIRAPLGTLYMRKHEFHPFEAVAPLEKLCQKHDHGLFSFGSASKKRPFRLVLGRNFDGTLLDMQEYTVKDFKSLSDFRTKQKLKDSQQGNKPLIVFQGAAFESDERMKRAKSLLLDFFSGPRPEKVMLSGVESVIVISTIDTPGSNSEKPPSIHFRRYIVAMQKSGSKLPHIELEECGPKFTLDIDRVKEPDRERWKQSIKVPKAAKAKTVKNVNKGKMGERKGKIHLGKQLFDTIHTVHHGETKRKKLKTEMDAAKADVKADAA